MNELRPPEEHLYDRIAGILDEARARVARTVNTAMVQAYWHIGREIVEVEQLGAERAEYGEELLKNLAAKLMQRFGKGFNLTGLKRMRQFYRAFPDGSALPVELGGPKKVPQCVTFPAVSQKVPHCGTFLPRLRIRCSHRSCPGPTTGSC